MAARVDSLLFSIFPHRNSLPVLRLFHSLGSASSRTIDLRRSSSKLVSRRMASASSDSRAPPPPTHTITLPGGDAVQVVAAPGLSNSDLRNAIDSALFRQWLKNMQSEMGVLARGQMCLRQVHIQSKKGKMGLDMFGRGVGFLKFKADVVEKETGRKIPGIVFARGPSVAVLILLESGGETYVVLTEQVRVPVGKFILELPAGMLDDERGDVVGTAVREVEEETGICLNIEDMVNLTAFLDPTTGYKVFPSPGGCDEELSLFLYRGHVEEQIINSLQGKEMGLRDHGELIKVHVVPYDKLWRVTADAKALAAIALYEMAKRDGLLPQRNMQNLST
uniref:Nudix hydrolase 14, chloroplastic n=1 Tax=Elaeis guineensis var. tenera TaxID=51953 RepID=A0A8N4F8U2_ELAGV|nr:nudix hydrolase 14, chloroplastic [Elaeis guineensis]